MVVDRYIGQPEGGNGCGIACAAMLSGTDYRTALEAFPERQRRREITGSEGIQAALITLESPWVLARTRAIRVEMNQGRAREWVMEQNQSLIVRTRAIGRIFHFLIWDIEIPRFWDPADIRNTEGEGWEFESYYPLQPNPAIRQNRVM